MELSQRDGQRILLLSLLAIIGPMLLLKAQFTSDVLAVRDVLQEPSLVNVMYEFVFYGAVVFLFRRKSNLIQLFQAAGVCLMFRLAIGASLAVLLAAVYGMEFDLCIKYGLTRYLPGILFHIVAMPFILWPVLRKIGVDDEEPTRRSYQRDDYADRDRQPNYASSTHANPSAVATPELATPVGSASERHHAYSARPATEQPPKIIGDLNGFERAVRYIGEHGSVGLAVVVDHEGLILANFARGNLEPEDWAPLSLLFLENNQAVIDRGNWGEVEKLDLQLGDERVIVARVGDHSLLVVAERQIDDVVNIRFIQAIEMIRKHVAERYSKMLNQNAEKIHVSST